jgi:hypothetical protein
MELQTRTGYPITRESVGTLPQCLRDVSEMRREICASLAPYEGAKLDEDELRVFLLCDSNEMREKWFIDRFGLVEVNGALYRSDITDIERIVRKSCPIN